MATVKSTFQLSDIQFDQAVVELFELIPHVYFFIKDKQGRLVHCNETHRRGIFRYADAATIYGKDNYDFFPNALAESFAEDDRRVIDTGVSLVERVELNIESSGSLWWFCTTKVPARNSSGVIVGLIGISRRLESADDRLSEYDLVMPAIEFIHENRAKRILISTLADLCDMPEVSFRREFQKLFRLSPSKFITRLRLHDACSMLVSNSKSIGKIAYECGFEDQNYFARQFKKNMGMTPTGFRSHFDPNASN